MSARSNAERFTIPQHVAVLTLGVADIARARAFYDTAFGWEATSSDDDVVFYQLQGAVLALWKRELLADDAQLSEEQLRPGGISIAHNLPSPQAVDALVAACVAAGGRVSRAATQAPWGGYSAYITDPDGHLWEFAYNPGWHLFVDGRIAIPAATDAQDRD